MSRGRRFYASPPTELRKSCWTFSRYRKYPATSSKLRLSSGFSLQNPSLSIYLSIYLVRLHLISNMGKGKGIFDLERHFAFYGAYHSNPVNVLIHMFFVWPIFYTTLILFHFTPPFLNLDLPLWSGAHLDLNFGFLFASVYGLFYFFMDRKAGSLGALLCLLCWLGSESLADRLGYSLAWKVVLASQLFCWTGQFIGHGVFEKRAPALLDNLTQALVMAPFFVLLEALEKFFGYEPYPGFHARVSAKIDADRKAWQESKQKKIS